MGPDCSWSSRRPKSVRSDIDPRQGVSQHVIQKPSLKSALHPTKTKIYCSPLPAPTWDRWSGIAAFKGLRAKSPGASWPHAHNDDLDELRVHVDDKASEQQG